jgi:hypothetical protein
MLARDRSAAPRALLAVWRRRVRCSWLRYYLAHNTIGPTKGVWWEHVVPAAAFTILQQQQQLLQLELLQQQAGVRAHSRSAGCPQQLHELAAAAAAAQLLVDSDAGLECACNQQHAQQLPAHGLRAAWHANSSSSFAAPPGNNGSWPVPAANVTQAFVRLSSAMRVIRASEAALAWLKSAEGAAAFPALAPGSSTP